MITIIMDYASCSPADVIRHVLLSVLNVMPEVARIDSEIFEVILTPFDGSDDIDDCVTMALELMDVFGGMCDDEI